MYSAIDPCAYCFVAGLRSVSAVLALYDDRREAAQLRQSLVPFNSDRKWIGETKWRHVDWLHVNGVTQSQIGTAANTEEEEDVRPRATRSNRVYGFQLFLRFSGVVHSQSGGRAAIVGGSAWKPRAHPERVTRRASIRCELSFAG